jgi:tetratricopeptide (TPR) repeat protein
MFMKNHVGLAALITTIIFSITLQATAQESTFEDNTLYNLKLKAETFSNDSIVRVTIIEENFKNGDKVPENSIKYTNEVIPPNGSNLIYKSHFISEKTTKNGVEREEFITIGNQRYIKKNNSKWEVFNPMGSGNGSGESVKIETSSDNKLQRGVIINNQKTDYYQTTTTYKHLYPTGTLIRYFKEGFWFDSTGRYVQTLEESFNGETKNINRKTTVYEYNPNIKIEAPIKINDSQLVNLENHQTSDSDALAKQYLGTGRTYLDKNDFDSAIKEFTKAIEINPLYDKAYGLRGFAYLGKKDFDSTIRDFTKVIEINPQDYRGYAARGLAYSEKKDFESAVKNFTKSVELNPKDAFLYYNRGIAYKNKEVLDLTIKDHTKAIEINPKYAEAYFERALSYLDKSDFDLAIKDYTKVMEINPQSAEAYNNRGLAYYSQEKYEQAISDFTKSLQYNNTNINAYKLRALSYRAVKKNKLAVADEQKYKELGGK